MSAGGAPFLPYGRQQVEDADVEAVAAVLRSEMLTTGPTVEAFEAALAGHVGAAHAVACSSGTAALHLAALALGLGPGDWVVVPAVTFLATANAARFVGADVMFADVDPETGQMRAADLAAALERADRDGRNVRAVFPVHLNGSLGEIEAVAATARARGLAVVEDACHALGTTYRTSGGAEARVGDGRISEMTVFSFHPVKLVACGEGGAVTSNDEALAGRLRLYRNHGMVRDPAALEDRGGAGDPWYYEMQALGFNYRISDIQCALGLSQLGRIAAACDRRRRLMRLYDEALAPLAPLVRPVPRPAAVDPVLHLYAVLIDFARAGLSRAELMKRLRARGIGTQVHYIPVHRQPYYRRLYGARSLPGAEAYYERVLSLPFFPAMADEDVDRVVGALCAEFEVHASK